ncbi:hypothetical protein BO94DRAFT_537198 [Aspergillus sclerotioniger CBS 115572]|uniref:Uncharacterized protein n=1 Tax=Aspergillus sclerotioniger CBS 115572 TaxID=1450535 RepID=A0A317W2U4_9EURO|nr:hypothetical protein BO94DRAFT_537198 [Aspergillus sclerotioniger CBS 115572]PWY80325.1 hypothetical protein BO94DRAFT_537198 [Aspergillus sclerotioniger CBS 115572]
MTLTSMLSTQNASSCRAINSCFSCLVFAPRNLGIIKARGVSCWGSMLQVRILGREKPPDKVRPLGRRWSKHKNSLFQHP